MTSRLLRALIALAALWPVGALAQTTSPLPSLIGLPRGFVGCQYSPTAPTIGSYAGSLLQCNSSGSLLTTDNLYQIGGNAVVTGGANGSLGVGGLAASGQALVGNPVLIAGGNGTDAYTLNTDTNGNLKVIGIGSAGTPSGGVFTVQGSTATGSALASYPVLIGGSDGTDVRNLATNSSGQAVVVGAGTAGSASGGVVTVQGVSSMTALLVNPGTIATWGLAAQGGASAPTNALAIAGVYNSSLPTISNTDAGALQMDSSARLIAVGAGTAGTPAGGLFTVQGSTATGSALASYPVLVAGSDGTDVRNLATNTSGQAVVVGAGTAGSPSGGLLTVQGGTATGSALASNPILVGGSDGTDVRNLATNSSGQAVVVGAGTAGSASGGVVTVQGVSSMTALLVNPGTISTWGLAATGGASATTNAMTVAGVYNTTLPTITNTDVAGIQIDGFGRIIQAPRTVTSNTLVKGTTSAMTGTSSTQVIAAVSSQHIYVTSIHCNNSSSTATLVLIQDGSGGTTLDTLICPAGGGDERNNGYTPLFWTTAGNALYAADVTTGASVIVQASGYSSAN